MEKDCPFCKEQNSIIENSFAKAFYDNYPISPGHLLIVPKRHVSSWFDLTTNEKLAILEITQKLYELEKETKIDGYNIGINIGEVAGQSVMHCHVHLIPRYKGDVEDPYGGVRNIIPGKGRY